MADPIEVHRLRKAWEHGRRDIVVKTDDIEYILHAYDTMIDGLVEIQKTSRSLSDAEKATVLLNRIDYVGPTY